MHEVTDGYGRAVRVPLNPSRIVSLAPSLTETLYALGVEDRLVGDTDYCDYPPDAQKKPKVGGVINPNLEQIAALHPDLVLLSKEGNMLDTVRALDTLGIPTYATDAHTIDQIISSVQKLADVLNAASAGKALTDDLQLRLQTLQAKLNGVPPKRVLFIVWPEPLMSVGKAPSSPMPFVEQARPPSLIQTRIGPRSISKKSHDFSQTISSSPLLTPAPPAMISNPWQIAPAGRFWTPYANVVMSSSARQSSALRHALSL